MNDEHSLLQRMGLRARTRKGGEKIRQILKGREIKQVCGSHYVADYWDWKTKFDQLLK